MEQVLRPLPEIDAASRPFWEAAREHRFVLPRCRRCGHRWFPPYARCTRCLSPDREFVAASGRGRIWGVIEMSRPYIPAFAERLPYNVVLVELEEGPKMFSNVVGAPFERILVDAPVEVMFEDIDGQVTLPKFRLAERP